MISSNPYFHVPLLNLVRPYVHLQFRTGIEDEGNMRAFPVSHAAG